MKLTNSSNLPQAIVNAVANDPYDSSGSNISTTMLIKPPRIRMLQKLNDEYIVEDVSDKIFALIGQNTHHIIERAKAADDMSEERLFATVNKWKISGQFDLLTKNGELIDFKVTSVWAALDAMTNGKSEWEQQLNILDYLCRVNKIKYKVTSLQIMAILRDWSKLKALQSSNYPKQQCIMIPVRQWTHKEQEQFILDRVKQHQKAEETLTLPICTPLERWKKEDSYAIMKDGRKTALRVLPSMKQVQEYKKQKNIINAKGITVVERKGEDVRCHHYCNVNRFCDFYAELKSKF